MLLSCTGSHHVADLAATSLLLLDFLFFFAKFFYLFLLHLLLFLGAHLRCSVINVANGVDLETNGGRVELLQETMHKSLFSLVSTFERICLIGIEVGET